MVWCPFLELSGRARGNGSRDRKSSSCSRPTRRRTLLRRRAHLHRVPREEGGGTMNISSKIPCDRRDVSPILRRICRHCYAERFLPCALHPAGTVPREVPRAESLVVINASSTISSQRRAHRRTATRRTAARPHRRPAVRPPTHSSAPSTPNSAPTDAQPRADAPQCAAQQRVH